MKEQIEQMLNSVEKGNYSEAETIAESFESEFKEFKKLIKRQVQSEKELKERFGSTK